MRLLTTTSITHSWFKARPTSADHANVAHEPAEECLLSSYWPKIEIDPLRTLASCEKTAITLKLVTLCFVVPIHGVGELN